MEKIDVRLVLQVKEYCHGHQIVDTHPIYMQLTEKQIAVLSDVFDTSDKVQCHLWGRKKDS